MARAIEPEQLYLITVQRMCTSDDADLVSGWSAILPTSRLGDLDLIVAAEATGISLKECPIEGIRPMTDEEINEWRRSEKQ